MVWIVLVAVLLLLGLSWLPEMGVGDGQFRPIDLLADVRADSLGDDIEQLDSAPVVEHRVLSDTCRAGMTCINDMSDSTERGMTPLYHALTHINELGRPVRIAVLGDSYIEGDIFTADLRELLQKHYGGHGVGLVPITSDSPGFRRSVIHQFGGWTAHNANSKSGYNSQWANLTGHYFTAGNGAWVELSGVSKYLSRLDTCSTSSLIFLGSGTASVTATINGGEQQHFTASPQNGAGVLTTRGRIGRVRWTVTQSAGSQMAMIGATMEDEGGVVVDNYSLRSTSGLRQGMEENDILPAICATTTVIDAMDYRAIYSVPTEDEKSLKSVGEGAQIPATTIRTKENLIKLHKRGRMLVASYEAIRFQKLDLFSVMLRQIGAQIQAQHVADAVDVLVNGDGNNNAATAYAVGTSPIGGTSGTLTYDELVEFWAQFDPYEMNTMIAPTSGFLALLKLDELQNPLTGLNFQGTGKLENPLGAQLLRSDAVASGKLLGLDRRYALEMVCAGDVSVEFDKLIDRQLERAAISSISGFAKICDNASASLTI